MTRPGRAILTGIPLLVFTVSAITAPLSDLTLVAWAASLLALLVMAVTQHVAYRREAARRARRLKLLKSLRTGRA
jgi:membrane protein implicated in regulation of membrane protease activity